LTVIPLKLDWEFLLNPLNGKRKLAKLSYKNNGKTGKFTPDPQVQNSIFPQFQFNFN
jgi:hypothetical protein